MGAAASRVWWGAFTASLANAMVFIRTETPFRSMKAPGPSPPVLGDPKNQIGPDATLDLDQMVSFRLMKAISEIPAPASWSQYITDQCTASQQGGSEPGEPPSHFRYQKTELWLLNVT